tara:strand:- start:136 stop:333 length:198 start_codon:yes stop_codon:yes gene_type:complete
MGKYLNLKWFREYIQIYRDSGWKGIRSKGGKKLIVAVFLFFFIKGFVLYIIPLYLALQGVNSCGN